MARVSARRFDLAIIDPTGPSENHWRIQQKRDSYSRHKLKTAIEFGLNAIGTTRLDLTNFKKNLERSACGRGTPASCTSCTKRNNLLSSIIFEV